MRALFVLLLVAAAGGLLFWVASGEVRGTREAPVEVAQLGGRPQGHVYTGVLEEPMSLNPLVAAAPGVVSGVLRYTLDGLCAWNPASGALQPAVAESWEVGGDGRTVRFAIRPGVRFANGEPVTRADLLFPWEVAQHHDLAGTRLGSILAQVVAVRATEAGPAELELELRAPGLRTLGTVASGYWVLHRASFIDRAGVPPEHPEFLDRVAVYTGAGVGTGPYQVLDTDWRKGQDVLLTRNVHAWHRVAHPGTWNLAGIRWRVPSSIGVTELALEEGLLDVVPHSSGPELLAANPAIAARYRVVEYAHPLVQPYRVVWNLRDPTLADVRVRQALDLLTPRRELVEQVLRGRGTAATGPFAADHPATLAAAAASAEPSRAAALELLRDAGFDAATRPLEIEVLLPSGDPVFDQTGAFLQEAWRKAGIVVELTSLENSAFSERVFGRRFQGTLYMGQDPIPLRDMYPFLHSAEVDGLNHSGYARAEVDQALEAIRAAPDEATALAAEQELCRWLLEDQPILWLYHRDVGVLLDRRIEGVVPGALGLSPDTFWVPADVQRRR